MVRLGDVITVTSGGTPSRGVRENWLGNTLHPWIKTGDLKSMYLSEAEEYITDYGLENSSAKLFPQNTVLLAMYGATIGACSILKIDATTNQACAALLPTDKYSPQFLYYYFASIKPKLIGLGVGGAQPNISGTIIKSLQIPLPPVDVQKKIADALDRASALIEKRKAQIAKMDLLVKVKFLDMFGDPITNPKKLPAKNFVDIVKLQRGFDLPNGARDKNGKIPVYGSNGILGYHGEPKITAKGIVTGRSGTIGKVYCVEEPYWPLNTTLFSIETYDNNIAYLAYLVLFFRLERFVEGSGVPTLNRNIVHKEKIFDAPLELQHRFADFVRQVEKSKAQMQHGLGKLELLYKSLMQKCFAGEIF
ncbi:MAG: restriction endonuclease subunit S [Defluviitaleaceae bacterium]|nr:restriction endonuclease subunit S [Defluviitaleaceae bacterium]